MSIIPLYYPVPYQEFSSIRLKGLHIESLSKGTVARKKAEIGPDRPWTSIYSSHASQNIGVQSGLLKFMCWYWSGMCEHSNSIPGEIVWDLQEKVLEK